MEKLDRNDDRIDVVLPCPITLEIGPVTVHGTAIRLRYTVLHRAHTAGVEPFVRRGGTGDEHQVQPHLVDPSIEIIRTGPDTERLLAQFTDGGWPAGQDLHAEYFHQDGALFIWHVQPAWDPAGRNVAPLWRAFETHLLDRYPQTGAVYTERGAACYWDYRRADALLPDLGFEPLVSLPGYYIKSR